MKTFYAQLLVVFVAVSFTALFPSPCFSALCYAVTDLGALNGETSYATSINNSGQVVGYSSCDGYNHAFLWQNGAMQDLGTLGGVSSYAYGINNTGKIVGCADNGIGIPHAFIYDGAMQDPSSYMPSVFSTAYGVNDCGQVVGEGNFGSIHGYAYSYSGSGAVTEENMSSVVIGSGVATGVNNNGQVVGTSYENNQAFLRSGSQMQSLGTLAGSGSQAYAVNNNGNVVGHSANSSGKDRAFIWQNSSGMKDLGAISSNAPSYAAAINNNSQVVGHSYTAAGQEHAFLWQENSGIQDLNNLISPYSGWTLNKATAINNLGHIVGTGKNAEGKEHAFLLMPTGNCQDFKVLPKCYTSIERLAKWDGANWVPVTSGELSSGNIHVLVHGWGPGLKTFSENGGKIWDANDPVTNKDDNIDSYNRYIQMAQNIKSVAPGDTVVLFNWLDMSATENSLKKAQQSRDKTDDAAACLSDALKSACDFNSSFNGKIQLFGVSHGARVAAFATKLLYNDGKEGSVVINQLTFGDSPELGYKNIGGPNDLDSIFSNIKIGRDSNSTFIDNYYSSFLGRSYSFDDIVNVKLNPNPQFIIEDKHSYPLDWYSSASVFASNLGIGWSPLLGDTYQLLASNYEQDSLINGEFEPSMEFALKESGTSDYLPIRLRSNMSLATLLTQGTVTNVSNGKCLTEASPSFWHTSFSKGVNDTTLEFSYQFLNPGDGDQLGIWIDDELRFIITGELVGTEILMSDIDISDLSVGDHILSVALHNYGDANASVQIFDFTMISVPEPSSLYLLCVATVFIAIALLRQKLARA
jgi:probable HAF family extracellular repeat protein